MKKLDELLLELGISKVRLAKYLGVSRQMLYNYLALSSLDDWPKEKALKLNEKCPRSTAGECNRLLSDRSAVRFCPEPPFMFIRSDECARSSAG